jgi:uncharacterized protein (DUF58 family)
MISSNVVLVNGAIVVVVGGVSIIVIAIAIATVASFAIGRIWVLLLLLLMIFRLGGMRLQAENFFDQSRCSVEKGIAGQQGKQKGQKMVVAVVAVHVVVVVLVVRIKDALGLEEGRNRIHEFPEARQRFVPAVSQPVRGR